ncbi:MAG: two-component sensor histidine kinase [Candidatus Eisenbacteria bacterium]|nr:two-component sensor histidine kinase [Candidatus Eisenbacteria bacterium]
MAISRSNLPTLLRAYLFLGSFVLVAVAFAYSYSWVRKVNEESAAISQLLARFVAASALEAADNPELGEIFSDVVKPSDLPIILTDRAGRPFVWNNIGIDRHAIEIEEISHWDPGEPAPAVLQRILDRMEEFDRIHDPIPIRFEGTDKDFGYVHYGERKLAAELRRIPLMQLGVIAVFIALGYLGYRSVKTSEQRAIWIGLAKETAHQLGSPISSLLGWVEVLRERVSEAQEAAGDESAPQVELPSIFVSEVLAEMEDDADRLSKIAKRFGQVGSVPRLETSDIVPIVSSAARYLQRRLPHLKKEIEIQEAYDVVPRVNVNEELMEWVIENVLKNAVDATRSGGVIKVSVVHDHKTESVEIRITDEGRGMSASEARQVFSPGFSTKGRGWGLGLTLAKRIIEDYHGGKIWVERTALGKGTTFVIAFPV